MMGISADPRSDSDTAGGVSAPPVGAPPAGAVNASRPSNTIAAYFATVSGVSRPEATRIPV